MLWLLMALKDLYLKVNFICKGKSIDREETMVAWGWGGDRNKTITGDRDLTGDKHVLKLDYSAGFTTL